MAKDENKKDQTQDQGQQQGPASPPAAPPPQVQTPQQQSGDAMMNEIQRQALLARASGEADAAAAEEATHVVAAGTSVSTVRGIVGDGKPVTPHDFAFNGDFHSKPGDAQRDFDALVRRGAIVKKAQEPKVDGSQG